MEIADDLFDELEGIHVEFGASEAAAFLRLLERESVERTVDDPVRDESTGKHR